MTPNSSPSSNMQILDFIEAPSAEDAMEMFKEDNEGCKEAGFTEFFCIPLSVEEFKRFTL